MAQPSPPGRQSDDERRIQREYVRYSGMGIEFGVLICLFAWLGWWLDGKTGLADEFPAFLILGVFVGMVLGIYRMKVHLDRGSQSSRKSGKQSGRDDGSAS